MSDNRTPDQRHRNMAAIHSASTTPELKVRHALWRQGFRYRINDRRLPGKPDIVLPKYRTAIFIHGCFWHGHKGCKDYTIPKTNTTFWTDKIAKNQEHDQEVWRCLEAKGWAVIIVWECQLKKDVINNTISQVIGEIHHNGEIFLQMKEQRKSISASYRQVRKAYREKEAALMTELKGKRDNL